MENIVVPRQGFKWAKHLVRELTEFEQDARESKRHKITMEVIVRPVNGDGTTFGAAYRAVSTDISATGLGFLHRRPVSDKYLCVTFRTEAELSVIIEVVRCRPVGPLFEVGGVFVRKLDGVLL